MITHILGVYAIPESDPEAFIVVVKADADTKPKGYMWTTTEEMSEAEAGAFLRGFGIPEPRIGFLIQHARWAQERVGGDPRSAENEPAQGAHGPRSR